MERRATGCLLLVLLAGLYQPGWGLVCGTGAFQASRHMDSTGRLRALVVFARFQDEATGEIAAPAFAGQLFDPERPGSLTHFYQEMSWGQFQLTGVCLPRWYTAKGPAADYQRRGFPQFAHEILLMVDAEVDLGQYDDDGPDGIPNSGDDDGCVDLVFINTLTTPPDFIADQANGIARLGLGDYVADDRAHNGGFIRVRADGDPQGVGGTLQQGHTFAEAVGNMAHEFGHVLGLPDLYDLDYGQRQDAENPERDSAGIGYWGLMGHGARGWDDQGGPNPFEAWSLARLGWVGVGNQNLVEILDRFDQAVFGDVRTGGQVYKLPTDDPYEYFLIEYRRPDHSFYERHLPGSGLLIWHVDEKVGNNDTEESKLLDLVCADGLYLDAGFPLGQVALPELGRDNLDFWAHDEEYRQAHQGNLGDATDMYDGVRFTEFSQLTNPAALHGIRVGNIHREGDAMVADLRVDNREWAGTVARQQVWKDTVEVVGDVVVAPGVRLTLAPGTVVLFREDQAHRGADPQRCELVVEGELVAPRSTASVLMTSGAARPAPGDWRGIVVGHDGTLDLNSVAIEYAQEGISGQGTERPQTLKNVAVRHASGCGICLEEADDSVLMSHVEVTQAGGVGARIQTKGLTQVDACRFTGSGQTGLEVVDGGVDCQGSEFADNGVDQEKAANLVLENVSRGTVVDNHFQGGVGIRCVTTGDVWVERNELSGHRIGLVSLNARPWIARNHFVQNELAIQISGFQVPGQLELNMVEGEGELVVNQAAVGVVARNNWWGQADEAWIAARIEGPVEWHPFLNFDPRQPVDFTLALNYPNPFNGSTVIDYTVGINVSAIKGDVELSLEVRNLAGGLVRRLVRQPAAPGIYEAVWDGRDEQGVPVASGVYYCLLRVDPILLTRKLMVLK